MLWNGVTDQRFFFLGAFMDFEFLKGSLYGVVFISFNFLLLLLFPIAYKLSSHVFEPEDLDL